MVFARQGCPTGRHPCRAAGLRASSGGIRHPAHGSSDIPHWRYGRPATFRSRACSSRARDRVYIIKVIPASQLYTIARFYAIGGFPDSYVRVFPY